MSVETKISNGQMHVKSPFNSGFVAAAKRLSGRFSVGVWSFDERNAAAARKALVEAYGTDGESPADTVSVRITWDEECWEYCAPIEFAGRTVARAFGRDSGAKTGDGVVIEAGGFTSGGSVKNWKTVIKAGTVVLMHDVPRASAEAFAEADDLARVEIVKPEGTAAVDREALIAERARLAARIADIDAALARGGE
mgnify:FL=1